MGYRSEVCLAVVVKTAAQADELMAIYAMHPLVQEYDLANQWVRTDTTDAVFFHYYSNYSKWYEGYGDVQGMEHMLTLAKTFSEERIQQGFPYAAVKVRIGEEYQDIETNNHSSDANLEDALLERVNIHRSIAVDF